MENKIINAEGLKKMMDEKKDFILLDVMNPEYFAERHIAGSINAPVYEVVFLSYLEKMEISKDKKIVVYNESEKSLATADAAMKLKKAGYMDVYEFPGGLTKWEQAGYAIEIGEAVPVPMLVDGEYKLDTENSVVGWTGRNAKYAHHGKITVKSGKITLKDGNVIDGEVVLDMTTIEDDDLMDDTLKGVLESHLKSSDFFDVENYPEASFKFDTTEKIVGALIGTPNAIGKGSLTIKGITNSISFPMMMVTMEDGAINGQAHFDFDRTLWNVRYGSEKFFEKLGIHLVNDVISLELFLVAKL